MRLAVLLALLAFGCSNARQPRAESQPQQWQRVSSAQDCAPHAPNLAIALRPDFEAGLIEHVNGDHFPHPRCWYETPDGDLLLRAGRLPTRPDHEHPDQPCHPPDQTRHASSESAGESAPAASPDDVTVDLRGYVPSTTGLVEVCYRNEGAGWSVLVVSILISE